MGQDEPAVENYKIYIANYPNDARAYQNIGIVYKRLNQLDNTIANYEKALELQKDNRDADLVEDLAECYHLKHDYTNALKYYNEALLTKKDDYNLRFNKALVLHAMKDYNGAIAMYSELLKEKPNDSISNNMTSAYVSLGEDNLKVQNYTLSTEYFEKAIENGTKDSMAYFGLAKSYRACGINEKATEYYEKAIEMSPEKTQYSKEFAEFIASSSKTADVKSTGATDTDGIKEISLSMDDIRAGEIADAEQNKSAIAKGDENYKSKNYDTAIKNYQDALKINPSDEVTLLKIGNIYKLKNDNRNAISFYKKSIVVNPNYADGWFNLGLVYANDKNNNKAKEAFHRVITLNPNYGYAYYALGIAYEQDGNTKEALNNYKIFLTHSKDEATTKAVETKIKTLEK